MSQKPNKISISTFIKPLSPEENLEIRKRWQGLPNYQILTMERVLPLALEYHFSNFQKLEQLAAPENFFDKRLSSQQWQEVKKAQEHIKFEVQAYFNHLRRTYFFIKYLQKNNNFLPPEDSNVRNVWDSLMEKEGMINLFSNKWAAHRSIDDQKGEDENFHMQILLNLEGGSTAWSGRHLILQIPGHVLNLCELHPKVLEFVQWMIFETEKLIITK